MIEELTAEQNEKIKKEIPKIGEIWVVAYPEIYYDDENSLIVKIQKRPFLILDDGRGLLVEDSENNYHGFKLTSRFNTKNDNNRRKEIKNWQEKGLLKKSYVRIEMPIKIEYQQFEKKITELDIDELKEMYIALYDILNIDALKKIVEEN